ncbi:lysosomal-trafficking regulator-like, partial [Lingula anatina]|uniref:Lysosomal-trafficking regulator-like n=1 Tax=Lingula anatina TaxID=7574 RepID=A0A2R2MLU9_LINAN
TVITPGLAFHLFGLGPDCCSVSQCDSSEQEAIYMYHINPQSLDTAGINQEVLIGNRSEDLQPLRENLLMVYIPKNPQQVNMYDPCGPKDGKTLTRLAMSLSTAQKASNEKILRQPLQVKPIKGQSSVFPLMHRGIEITVDEIGGVGVFLFLFAKVVENSTEQEQASALRLLFSLLRHSKKHAQDFKEMSGYSLLAKVMSTDKFINSFQVLKVLLDACLSESVIHFNTVTKAYSFIPYAKAIIQDVSIVREILLAWKVWDKGNVEVWHLCFVALEELIKEQHPYREFNRQQLHCAKTVDKLLVTCQERIQEACPSLPLPICSSMVKIIGHMMGSPPDINIVVTVCDFLLIAHPAASTFINHTADSFWFTHHWASGKKEKKKEKQSLSSTPSKGRSPSRTWHRSVEDVVETDQRNLTADVIAGERRLSVSLPSSPNTVKRQLSFKDSNFQFVASENSDSDILLSSAESRSRSQTYPPLAGCLDQKELTHALTTISTDTNEDNIEDKEALNDVENEEVFPPPQVEENDNSEDIFSKARNSAHTRINVHSTTMDSDACVISLGSASEDQIEHRDTFRGGDQEGPEISARIPSKDHSTPESYMTAVSGSSVNTKIADDTSPVISPGTGEVTEGGATAQSKPKELQNDSSNLLSDVSNSQSEDWELYPDPTSMNSVQVSLENANKDGIDEVDEGEKGLVVVCSGLLQLLQGVVINLCDVASKRILGMVLRPEVLLVLAHHNSPEIRTAVVQLLDVYFHRATDEQCENFLKIQGFHLLGSQLHQHQATRSLVEACLAMVFGKLHSMIDDIDPNQLSDLRPLQQSAITPVLALMEKTVYDTSLCHNAICLLIQLFETAPQMTQVMLENGLVEVLGNMVAAINKNEPRISDIIGEDEQQIVVEDIQHFAAMIAVKTFSTSGVSCYQQFDDMMTMFSILEMKEEERYGLQSRAVENVRSIQCSCFQAVLEFVETKCTIEDRGVVANLPLPYIKSASSLNDQSPLALPVVTSRRKTEGAVSLVPVSEREVTLEVSEESPESGAEDVVDTVFNLNASRTE